MSPLRRFAGTGVALLLAIGAAGLWWSVQPRSVETVEQAAIFRFEKEELVGVRVIRPDATLAFVREGDRWRTQGADFRPSASMIRRIAHQLHDLTARAEVVSEPEDLARYGLGPDAIEVQLDLADGRKLALAVGDPNPTSVSWYMRPLPDGPVYVVKKAAVDYYRLDLDAFREDRYAFFDAADCESIEARVDGRNLGFRRTGEQSWAMTAPFEWPADRDAVRRILGAVAASRALDFVADSPADLGPWGLGEDADQVALRLSSGEPVTVRLGAEIPGKEPAQRYVYRVEDRAVYAVRAAMVDPLQLPTESYRDPRVVGRSASDLAWIEVVHGGEQVRIEASSDSWRWEGGGAVPGATPRRVGSAAADLRALAFHDAPPDGAGLEPPAATVLLGLADGGSLRIELGAVGSVGRYARVEGDPAVYEVGPELMDRLVDLLREHSRRLDKEAERR